MAHERQDSGDPAPLRGSALRKAGVLAARDALEADCRHDGSLLGVLSPCNRAQPATLGERAADYPTTDYYNRLRRCALSHCRKTPVRTPSKRVLQRASSRRAPDKVEEPSLGLWYSLASSYASRAMEFLESMMEAETANRCVEMAFKKPFLRNTRSVRHPPPPLSVIGLVEPLWPAGRDGAGYSPKVC